MKKRSLHDRVILTVVMIAMIILLVSACFLDSGDFAEFFCILCGCEFVLAWFTLANRGRLFR